MKNVIVTGGAGFIGSHIVDALVEKGRHVAVIDNLVTGRKENLNPKATLYKVDISDTKVKKIIKKESPDAIFHLAAQINVRESVKDPLFDASVNILGSLNIIEGLIGCGSAEKRKIIFSSTGGAIYGDADLVPTPETYREFPLSPYGICKLSVERYLNYFNKITGLPYVALRYGNVYGPRQNSKGEAGVVSIFCDKMLIAEQPIINGDGKQTRDYVYVKDVVRANMLALESDKVDVFNIGTQKETDVNYLFNKIKDLLKSDFIEAHGPAQQGEQKRSCLNIEKAARELNWKPEYTLDKGLEETVEWFKQGE